MEDQGREDWVHPVLNQEGYLGYVVGGGTDLVVLEIDMHFGYRGELGAFGDGRAEQC